MAARDNIVRNKSFDFALGVIELYKHLVQHKEVVLARQLLKSGTSIGANVEEASAAQTKKDFAAKMSIAAKESRETRYWLLLLHRSQVVKYDYTKYLNEVDELVRLTTAIVKTSQNNLK